MLRVFLHAGGCAVGRAVCFAVCLALGCITALCLAAPALAALKSSNDATPMTPEAVCNPVPAAGDIVLPMPNGLCCVLRAVAIPAQGALYDKKFPMGLGQTSGDRNIYESRIDAFVAAPLRQDDLPAAWRKNLPADEASDYFYYFMGKYEISNAQWHAVMGDSAPANEQPDRPRTDISWYDMQDFLHRYNMWLMANHADMLPAIDGHVSFLRLPSEEEWEFAARGGNRPPEQMEFEDFPLEQGKRVEDYAVFGKENPLPIGSKNANPLGLHDMGGNVAELVQSSFQFTIADATGSGIVRRLHGSHGGMVSKGGSFLDSAEQDMFPGKRVELDMFRNKAPYAARNLGMRVVLANINVAGDRRARMLDAEYAAMTGSESAPQKKRETVQPDTAKQDTGKNATAEDRLVKLDASGNTLKELDKIIAAAGSPFMQSNLYQLRDMLQDQNSALEREKNTAMLNAIRSGAYQVDSIGHLSVRAWTTLNAVDLVAKDKRIDAKALEQRHKQALDFLSVLDASLNFYKVSVKELAAIPASVLAPKLGMVKKEYAGKDKMGERMRAKIALLEKHVAFARAKGIDALTPDMIRRDIIPADMLKGIDKGLEERRKRS